MNIIKDFSAFYNVTIVIECTISILNYKFNYN